MPYAEISIAKNLIEDEAKPNLAKKLTKILIDSEGLEDNPISRSIALLDIKEFDGLYVGGEKGHHEKVVVKIYAFSNAFSEETKKGLFSDITAAFIAASRKIQAQNGRNVWCMIMPLEEHAFGVGGIPVSLEMTKQLVASYKG